MAENQYVLTGPVLWPHRESREDSRSHSRDRPTPESGEHGGMAERQLDPLHHPRAVGSGGGCSESGANEAKDPG